MNDKAADDDERASEELREFEDRRPSPYPKLLMWTSTRGQNAKIIPSLVSPAALIGDYFEFARNHAMPASGHEPDLDRRLLPLLFVYRHATELALKYCIAQLIFHIRQRQTDFEDAVPEHHSLGGLLDKCRTLYEKAKGYLNELGTLDFISKQAQDFIRELDRLDPGGEAFRYSHRKREKKTGEVKPQIKDEVDVSVEALRAGMLHIEKELLWLIQMVEITSDLYAQGTADMLADSGW
jgi:hypothetical protein